MPTGEPNELDFGLTMRGAAKEQKLFGRYTLKRVLGRGGMGIVWLAHDDELNRYVAMKFLPDMLVRDREAVEDLKRETRRSLDLTHHHIVRIYDFTQDDMVAAIIMEYVDGETLSAMKTQQGGGCFGVSVLAPWVAHFCSALEYAHRQARVVHRDLKPANLMVNSRGDLKITDFGISRSMSDSMTRVSVSNTAGTLAYMSPEQALGAPPAPHDDIYALGATIYDLLTGRPPFFRGNLQVQLETVLPPPMADRRTELGNSAEPIPENWEAVIARCLAKRPQDRPQSVGEVAAMLGLGAISSHFRPSTSTGTTLAGTGMTLTRVSGIEDSATDTNFAPVTPRTSTPPSSTPLGGPRPTALGDILSGSSEDRAYQTPARGGLVNEAEQLRPTLSTEDVTAPVASLSGLISAPRASISVEAEHPPTASVSSEAALAEAPPVAKSETSSGTLPEESSAEVLAPVTTEAPAFEPPRRPRSGLAGAAIGSLGLVAVVGLYMFLRPSQEPSKSLLKPALSDIAGTAATPQPTPSYAKELDEIRARVAADRPDEAAALLATLPMALDGVSELQTAIATKRVELAKREEMRAEALKREQAQAKLLSDADAALARNEWANARSSIETILAMDPDNAAAKAKLQEIDDAEKAAKKMAADRETELRAKEMAQKAQAEEAENQRQRQVAAAEAERVRKAEEAKERERTQKEAASSKTTARKSPAKPARSAKNDDDDRPPVKTTKSSETSQRPPPQPVATQKKDTGSMPPSRNRSNTFRGGAPGG